METSDKESSPPSADTKLSRRMFFEKAAKVAAAAGVVGLGTLDSKQKPDSPKEVTPPFLEETTPAPEKELTSFSPKIIMIDFVSGKPIEGTHQLVPSDEEAIIHKQGETSVVSGFLTQFHNHGELVAHAIKSTWKQGGFEATTDIQLYPAQNILDLQSVRPIPDDELGNPGFAIDTDPKAIINALTQVPDQKIVNISLQLGKDMEFALIKKEKHEVTPIDEDGVGFSDKDGKVYWASAGTTEFSLATGEKLRPLTAEENQAYMKQKKEEVPEIFDINPPTPQIKGAYRKEKATENLKQLLEVCQRFPDKLFVSATGNFGDDIRDARKNLSASWPSNLLLAAEWSRRSEEPRNNVYGADIYVDNYWSGLNYGSSFSTAMLSGYASILEAQGLPIEEIKQKLITSSDRKTFSADGEEQETRVFSPQKLGVLEK